MKIMPCPLNGPRNISEFVYGGELKDMPDQNHCSDLEWADYVFNHDNLAGVVREWWMHAPSSYWFIAERNTITDEILKTYEKLGIPLDEQKLLAGVKGVAVDAVFDSVSVKTTYQEELEKLDRKSVV